MVLAAMTHNARDRFGEHHRGRGETPDLPCIAHIKNKVTIVDGSDFDREDDSGDDDVRISDLQRKMAAAKKAADRAAKKAKNSEKETTKAKWS